MIFPKYNANAEVTSNNKISIENIVDNEDYSKSKVTNFETGEVEYIEISYNDIGERKFTITSNQNNDIITIEDNDRIIVRENNKIIKTYENLDINENIKLVEMDSNIVVAAFGNWGPPTVYYGEKALWNGISAGVVGTLVSIILNLKPGSAIVVSIVSSIIGFKLTNIWYRRNTRYRVDIPNERYETKTVTDFYKYSSYMGCFETVTTITNRSTNDG